MAKQTLQQQYIAALQGRGCKIVPALTRKYVVLTRPLKPGTFYYVGSSGALRVGRIATRTLPVSEQFKATLLGRV